MKDLGYYTGHERIVHQRRRAELGSQTEYTTLFRSERCQHFATTLNFKNCMIRQGNCHDNEVEENFPVTGNGAHKEIEL